MLKKILKKQNFFKFSVREITFCYDETIDP